MEPLSDQDRRIIEAAQEAGLCFPQCWNLCQTPEDLESDERWVNAMDTNTKQRQIRQHILDQSREQRRNRLAQLRHFSELLQSYSQPSQASSIN
jgi:DNA-binding transcriptional MerR regulator